MKDKTILLMDMFGVIVTEDHLVTNVTSRLFPEVSLEDQRDAYHAYEQGRIGAGQYWKRLSSPWTVEESERRLFAFFHLDPGFLPLAGDLRGRMEIVVLSNVPRDWKPRLLAMGIGSVVKGFIASGEEYLWKPDPAIFRLAGERLQAAPERCIFVDDQKRNLSTASDLGMTTVWVDRSVATEPGRGRQGISSDYQPDYTVVDMTGLRRLLNP